MSCLDAGTVAMATIRPDTGVQGLLVLNIRGLSVKKQALLAGFSGSLTITEGKLTHLASYAELCANANLNAAGSMSPDISFTPN